MNDADPLRALLEAAVEGDDVALAELVRQAQPDIWRLCDLLGSGDDTEDLVQDTFLRAIRSLDTYRGEAAVRTWLLSVARHVCADQVRRRQRQRRLVDRLALQADLGPAAPQDRSVEELLTHIDADRREAFVLTQVLGLSYEEAAETVGCPIGTIRSRVARARSDLLALVRLADAR